MVDEAIPATENASLEMVAPSVARLILIRKLLMQAGCHLLFLGTSTTAANYQQLAKITEESRASAKYSISCLTHKSLPRFLLTVKDCEVWKNVCGELPTDENLNAVNPWLSTVFLRKVESLQDDLQ